MGENLIKSIEIPCPSCESFFWVNAYALSPEAPSRIWCPYCTEELNIRIFWKEKNDDRIPEIDLLEVVPPKHKTKSIEEK